MLSIRKPANSQEFPMNALKQLSLLLLFSAVFTEPTSAMRVRDLSINRTFG